MIKILKLLIPLVLIIIALVFLSRNPILAITKVNVSIINTECISDRTFNTNYNLIGKNILANSEDQINKTIGHKFLCVSHVEIERKLPNSVFVKIIGRTPTATVNYIPENIIEGQSSLSLGQSESTPSSSSAFELVAPSVNQSSPSASYLSDADGLLYQVVKDKSVEPALNVLSSGLSLGDTLDQGVIPNTLVVLNRLKSLSITPSNQPVIRGDYLYIESTQQQKLFFVLNSDIPTELASLQLILETYKINSGDSNPQMINSIDLRFSKPVVVYSKK